jgi:hypothetical protein
MHLNLKKLICSTELNTGRNCTYVRTCLHFKRLLLTDLLRCDAFINFPVNELKTHLERNEKGKISLEHQTVNIKYKRKSENKIVIVLDECEEQSCLALQQEH